MSEEIQARWTRTGGALWLGSAAAAIASLAIVLPYGITLSLADIQAALDGVARHPLAHAIELAFDALSYLAIALVAAPMVLLFGDRHRLSALLGGSLLAIGGTVGIVHDLSNFAFTAIAETVPTAGNAASRELVALAMLTTAKWGVTIAAMLYSAGILIFGVLMRGKVWAPFAWGAIAAALLALIAAPLPWIDPALEMAGYGLYLPMLVWQIAFGLRLVLSPL